MSVVELRRLLENLNSTQSHNGQLPFLLAKLNEMQQQQHLLSESRKPILNLPIDPKSTPNESISPDTTICDENAAEDKCKGDVESTRRPASESGSSDFKSQVVKMERYEPCVIDKLSLSHEAHDKKPFSAEQKPIGGETQVGDFRSADDRSKDAEKLGGFREAMAKMNELLDQTRRPFASDRIALMEQVMMIVVAAHQETCLYTSDRVAAGKAKYYASLRDKKSDEKLSAEAVWSQFVSNMAPVIRRVVVFSKNLPGFCELTQDDQIKLIKQGSFEVILARYTPLFTEDGMFVPDMTACVPMEVVRQMPLGDFFEEQFKFALEFNQLQLTDGEVGLLTAIMIINPDRHGISNRRAVQKLQILVSQSLYLLLKRSHPDMYDDLFLRVMKLLPWSSSINEIHSQKLNSIKMTSPALHFPQLHVEVYDRQQ